MNQILLEKTVEERHAELREKARKQGVKPIKRIEDLYGNFADDVDIDEFLEMVREIRNEGKNGVSDE
ncbi:MAG: hypothetical protein LH614_00220 [Pyrinomonadaceae bacterium]|nr:hypothetical protein [Pyrinomonadaceae bacterium]